MLGLSRRAGRVIIGTPLVTGKLPCGKVKITFCTLDASDNTKKRITDKCAYYNVALKMVDIPSSEIGKMLGMSTPVCVFGIEDDNFSKQLIALSKDE
jgi:ribosomal protein L7Ae-like RNA K-turn-binding protein